MKAPMQRRCRPAMMVAVVASMGVLTACGSGSTSDGPETTSSESDPSPYPDDAPADEKPAFEDKLSGADLRKSLKEGGYVIFMRHGLTEEDYADQADPKLDLDNCQTQRALSEEGFQQARTIGAAFTKMKIPVGDVYASQYCRAWQTADIALGKYEKKAELNFAPAEDYTKEQINDMKANLTPFLIKKPTQGTNTVVVGHDDVFESATGIYPEPSGIAFIIKPSGDSFRIVANLEAEEWETLAE